MKRIPRLLLLLAALAALSLLAHAASNKGPAPSAGHGDTLRVHLGAADAGTDAFVAWPPGKGPFPAVVVAHEWWGLNSQIREVGLRLAQQGYVAIIPDLYHGQVAGDPDNAHILMRGLDQDGAVGDLTAGLSWAASQPRISNQKIGILGFCMGGGLALQTALQSPNVAALVMFYGAPESKPEKIAMLKAPLLGHFGADDKGIDPKRVDDFRTALQSAGKSAELYVYQGAGHAFMNETQPSYRPDAAKLAWARTLAFYQKNLRGSK
jgi:carboxymethylenebutenolidase